MITISKNPDIPDFCSLTGSPFESNDPVRINLSQVGRIIDAQVHSLEDEKIEIPNYVIMPDHIHILLRVKYWLERDLGAYIGLFKTRCSKNWRELRENHKEDRSSLSVFLPRFNDRIAFTMEMAARLDHYISDNARRRRIAILYPQFFTRRQRIRICSEIYDIYGNFQLLREPMISAAIVSSRYSEDERKRYEREWDEAFRTGGVLVSPFISQQEKAIMRRGIAEGASIIRIIPEGLPPRYKPSGEEFALCAEGRCLHIGISKDSASKVVLKRDMALAMNDLARLIAYDKDLRMSLLDAHPQK